MLPLYLLGTLLTGLTEEVTMFAMLRSTYLFFPVNLISYQLQLGYKENVF